jgi:hypothetical protein
VEDTITKQRYLQQPQNVIPVAGHVNTTFIQQDGACLHTANVVLDVLRDVFGGHAKSNRFPERFGWDGPGHRVHRT